MYKKGFDKQVRTNTIEKIESYGYVNDKDYAERYVESVKNQKGINLIKQQLFAKGVSKQIIDEVLKEFSQEDELETLAKKVFKKQR